MLQSIVSPRFCAAYTCFEWYIRRVDRQIKSLKLKLSQQQEEILLRYKLSTQTIFLKMDSELVSYLAEQTAEPRLVIDEDEVQVYRPVGQGAKRRINSEESDVSEDGNSKPKRVRRSSVEIIFREIKKNNEKKLKDDFKASDYEELEDDDDDESIEEESDNEFEGESSSDEEESSYDSDSDYDSETEPEDSDDDFEAPVVKIPEDRQVLSAKRRCTRSLGVIVKTVEEVTHENRLKVNSMSVCDLPIDNMADLKVEHIKFYKRNTTFTEEELAEIEEDLLAEVKARYNNMRGDFRRSKTIETTEDDKKAGEVNKYDLDDDFIEKTESDEEEEITEDDSSEQETVVVEPVDE